MPLKHAIARDPAGMLYPVQHQILLFLTIPKLIILHIPKLRDHKELLWIT